MRDVREDDLPILFDHQQDPDASQMAAFTPRDRDEFMAHWAKILHDETVMKKTVLFDGEVAGNIVSFERDGEREVGYWIGRDYWGRGIATNALSEFLAHVTERLLFAHVAEHNLASIRVLENAGSPFLALGKRLPPNAARKSTKDPQARVAGQSLIGVASPRRAFRPA